MDHVTVFNRGHGAHQKPDADNIAKAVLDALSAFWQDDAQVAVLRVRKMWSVSWQAGTHIRIREAT